MLKSDETSDGRWEIFQAQKDRFDEITEVQKITIDTSPTEEESARKAIEEISNIRMQNEK
jgi:hypothetical protein